MTIDILLAVYNGAEYLPEQLRSLQAQTHGEWRLWVRDDGSTDGSQEVVLAAAAGDARIRPVHGGSGRLGALGGFSWLLEHAGDGQAPYTMFCDQDDVWLPRKIELTLAAMRRAEAELGPGVPVLVHTDLQVVDRGLGVIDPSFWHYQGIEPDLDGVNRILVQNSVTGCTAMVNRALRERASPVPPDAVMHDWWLALVASSFGRIVPLREATVLYRQHGRNDLGAHRTPRGLRTVPGALAALGKAGPLRAQLRRAALQAGAFARCFAGDLDDGQRRLLQRFAEIPECGPLERRWRLVRLGALMRRGLLRDIGYVLRA
ncbi:MAG TPA: glycosyltransferase family 2 protein [Longimicrobium sp.]